MQRFCQRCVLEIPLDVQRCPHCGTLQSSSGISVRKVESASSWKRTLLILLIGLIGGGSVVGGYWYWKVKPRLQGLGVVAPSSKKIRGSLEIQEEAVGDFDRKLTLPVEPLGFAFGKDEFVLGNRKDPWGFVRLEPNDDKSTFDLTTVPVLETGNMQRLSFNAIAWNGRHYISVTDGSWFNSPSKNVFCKHDSKSYEILATYPAPDQLGCLAFDGNDYWGATRSNTETSGEPVYLYRFDSELKEVSRHAARPKGCQGMAWDGQFLWLADVFNDSIYVLDISQDEPAIVHTLSTELSYLSGIVFDGRDMWVSEYENNEIHRLNPNVKRDVAKLLGAEPAQPGFVEASSSEEKRKDSYVNSSPDYPEENISVHEFSAEIISGAIYASWKIHFGEKLFSSESGQSSMMPVFARYIVSVTGPSLSQAVQETYEARDGMNEESEVELMRVAEQGTYNVSLFIHVQYIRPDGGYQILNKSTAPLTLHW